MADNKLVMTYTSSDEPVSLTFHSVLRSLYTEPSLDDAYHISVHFATPFQRRRFFINRQTRKKELPMVAICVYWS